MVMQAIRHTKAPIRRPTLYFDGRATGDDVVLVTDYAGIQDLFASGATWEGWARAFSAGPSNIGRLMEKPTASANFLMRFDDPSGGFCRLRFGAPFDGGTNGDWRTTNRVVRLTEVFHWAVTYDGGDTANDPIIYINGVAVDVTEIATPTGTIRAETGNLYVGNATGLNRAMDGYSDEVRVWSDIRTPAEIQQFYRQSLVGDESGLAGYWRMYEGLGTSVANKVSGGNAGAITGAAWRTRRGAPR